MAGELILVVDDNPQNSKLLEYMLRPSGYVVRVAASANETLAALAEIKPAVILMDIQMPEIDGLTLTRQLKADPATCNIIIIAVTAFAMRGDAEKSLAAGCAAHVTKPIDRKELLAVIAKHLA